MPGTENAPARPDLTAGIEALARLLEEEIAAIAQGNLHKVTELYPRKAALLEAIEAAAPAPGEDAAPDPDLRDKLVFLQQLIEKDAALLARVAEATRDLASEIGRIRDRHGLKGLYGAKGQAQGPTVAVSQRVDQQV